MFRTISALVFVLTSSLHAAQVATPTGVTATPIGLDQSAILSWNNDSTVQQYQIALNGNIVYQPVISATTLNGQIRSFNMVGLPNTDPPPVVTLRALNPPNTASNFSAPVQLIQTQQVVNVSVTSSVLPPNAATDSSLQEILASLSGVTISAMPPINFPTSFLGVSVEASVPLSVTCISGCSGSGGSGYQGVSLQAANTYLGVSIVAGLTFPAVQPVSQYTSSVPWIVQFVTSPTPSFTITPTPSPSFSVSPTPSITPTTSPTPSITPTWTPLYVYEGGPPWYVVNVLTQSPSFTISPTQTPTYSISPTPSITSTTSPTPSITPTWTPLYVFEGNSPWYVVNVLTQSPTFTVSPTRTATFSVSPSFTISATPSPTPTSTALMNCPILSCNVNSLGDARNYGCYGNGNFYLTDAVEDAIWRVSPLCGITEFSAYTSTNLPAPLCATMDGSGNLWVGNYDVNSTLTEINPGTGAVIGYWQVTPGGITSGGIQDVIWDGSSLWLAVASSNQVGRWNTTSHSMPFYATAQNNVNGLTWYKDSSGNEWIVAACNGFVNQISAVNYSIAWSNSQDNDGNVYRLTNDGTYIYAADFSVPGRVNKYIGSTGNLEKTWFVGSDLNDIAYDGMGYLWTVGNDNVANITDVNGNRLCSYPGMGETTAILNPGVSMMTLSYYYPSASQSYNFALSSIYSPSPTPITAVTAYQGSNPWYVVDVLTQTQTFTVSPTRTPSLTPSPSFSASPTTSPTPSITATPTNLFVYEGGSPWAVTIPTNTPGYNGVTVTSWTAPQYVGVSVTSWSASASIGTTVTAWTATQNVGVSLNAVTSPVPMYLSWVASAYSYTVGGTTFALNVANMFDYDVNTITAFSRKLAPTTSTYLSAAGATAVWASGYGLIYQITVNPASIPGSVITIIDGTVTRTSLSATCAQTYSYPRGVPINNGLSVVIYGQGYDGSVELETSR